MKGKSQSVKPKPKPTDKQESGERKTKPTAHKSPASQRREKKKQPANVLDTTSEGNFSLEEALTAIKNSNPSSSKKTTDQNSNQRFYSKFRQLDEPYRPLTAPFTDATSSSMGANKTLVGSPFQTRRGPLQGMWTTLTTMTLWKARSSTTPET